jgi:hypothetical protein
MTIMHFQEDVASRIGKILRKNKLERRNKTDVTEKLRREIKHLEQENRLKVNDIKRNSEQ